VILYLVASGKFSEEEFVSRIESSLKGGVDWVQLRIKDIEFLKRILERTLILKKDYNFKLIVNDFPHVALEFDADGVHIGDGDFEPEKARRLLKNKILGISCYNKLERGKMAERIKADYAAFGALFPTLTKPGAVRVLPDTIIRAKKELKIPICVIGGINRNNIEDVISLHPDIIAISSSIFLAEDPSREAGFFKRKISNDIL